MTFIQRSSGPLNLEKIAQDPEDDDPDIQIPALEEPEDKEKNGLPEGEAHQLEQETIGGNLSKIEREAYEKGFSAGEEAGRTLGLKKLDPVEKILLNLIQGVTQFKEAGLKKAEEDILSIALAIARRILRREVEGNPEVIVKNIQLAIKKIGQTKKVLIRLHPDDLEMISQDAEDIAGSTKQEIALRFEPDTGLTPGDCIVEGEERMVDARLDHQVDLIEEELKKDIE